MPKYHVTLESGRDFILDCPEGDDAMGVAYAAYDEACLMDDYLIDVELIDA